MTSATATPHTAASPAGTHFRFRRLLLAEWTKLRSVRSTMWSILLLVVLSVGFTALITALNTSQSQWNKMDASERARITSDPVGFILGGGFEFGQLTICVLGVLIMAGEYSTGVIRASLLAVPKRTPMLAAKSIVFTAFVFVVGELVAFPCFFIGASIVHKRAPVALGDPGVLRAVIGAGLYLAVLGLFALAIGGLLRHTAAGITGVIAFVLVLAPLAQLLPGSIGKHVHAYLPSEAGRLIAAAHQGKDDLLSPWQGFGVFCLWTAVLLVACGWLLNRRDA
ncbi:MAG: type transport system permease protein [Actinomycetota bacterium]|nr:type transport system permease protein [Actinomycetota bacterium]